MFVLATLPLLKVPDHIHLYLLFLALADVVRTSLGPRGMDKMIQDSKGEVLITNDGATILRQMEVIHPTAKMVHYQDSL